MMNDLSELASKVVDEDTFLIFVRALIEDRETSVRLEAANPSPPYGPDAGDWENVTIDAYLQGGVAWAEDSMFGRRMARPEFELGDVSPWRRFAAFLLAAKFYE